MRIATWNMWRPPAEGARVKSLLRQIEEQDADIWILTETRSSIALRGYCSFSSLPAHGMRPQECRTTIWSRKRIVRQIEVKDDRSSVCVEIAGGLLIYGTVLPDKGSGRKYPYQLGLTHHSGLRAWDLHYHSLKRVLTDLHELRNKFVNHGICLAGDLNQSLDNQRWTESKIRWSGTKESNQRLQRGLADVGLQCLTDVDFVALGDLVTRSTVHHICLDDDLAKKCTAVNAWEAAIMDGKKSSDHNGVYVDLAL